jgi:hypothetical protein
MVGSLAMLSTFAFLFRFLRGDHENGSIWVADITWDNQAYKREDESYA